MCAQFEDIDAFNSRTHVWRCCINLFKLFNDIRQTKNKDIVVYKILIMKLI